MDRWEKERRVQKIHFPWTTSMNSRRVVVALTAYALAGAGGVICARQWEHLALLWGLLVVAYAGILVDGRLLRPIRQG
jgi:hypothetical protein